MKSLLHTIVDYTDRKRRYGFTLLEIASVIVIIGLVIGGILVGKDIILASQARGLMSQMERFQVAATTFKLKYNCNAGDCNKATQFGIGSNGNGDNFLGPTTNIYTAYGGCIQNPGCATASESTVYGAVYSIYPLWGEIQWFWVHLSNAKLIEDEVTTLLSTDTDLDLDLYFPRDSIGKANLMAFMWNSKLYIRTGFTQSVPGTATNAMSYAAFTASALNSSQMNYIHTKLEANPLLRGLNSSNNSDPSNIATDVTSQGYPVVMRGAHRVIPVSLCNTPWCTSGAKDRVFVATGSAFASWVSHFKQQCAIPDDAGGFRYSVENNGSCNFLWRLDY